MPYIPQITMGSVVLREETKRTKNSDHKVNNQIKNDQNVKDDDVKNKNNICLFPVFITHVCDSSSVRLLACRTSDTLAATLLTN